MRRYRTEIVVPPDRYIGLQLPPSLPEGRAIVTVTIEEERPLDLPDLPELDAEDEDIEWWDEFADPALDESVELGRRSELK
ncbi:MAG TPA: hypothetical protein VGY53_04655 [Isosphaeraceae bacterium]|nr:hypothetical protein [Isosphaeraceae bacterium]